MAAHHATIDVVLGWAEREIVVTRTGHAGAVPLRTRGLVAARFDHYDSRAGDPNLHSHLAVANRVQGEDGVWRALDARLLHAAGVAMSELYDTLYADELTRRLGVTWQQVDRGPGRNPGFEIAGIDPGLLDAFSTRSHHITTHTDQLIAAVHRAARPGTVRAGGHPAPADRHPGHPTRQDPHPAARAAVPVAAPGGRVDRRHPRAAPRPRTPPPRRPRQREAGPAVAVVERPVQLDLFDPARDVDPRPWWGPARHRGCSPTPTSPRRRWTGYAAAAVAGVEARRSSWTPLNLMAETARATREVRMASVMDRMLLLDHTRDEATEGLVALHDPTTVHPAHAWRAKWTSPAVLDAEQALLAATQTPAAAIEESFVARVLDTAGTPMGDYYGLPDLSGEQAAAVTHLATQPTRLRVLEGPAGSGKTTTLRALAVLWQARAGQGTVIGLAPSASAAATLQAALGVPCENTAKWLHETTGPAGQQRAALAAQLLTAPAGRAVRGPLLRDVLAEQSRWTLPYRALLIVDEASLADTRTLAALTAQAHDAHAVILLVGDRHQGGPVGAGGAFGLLARHTHHAELAALHRYHHAWEAHATLGLRHGHPDALAAYAAHDRLHTAPAGTPPDAERDVLLDQAHAAWAADIAAGKHALLLAADTVTVTELNARARTHRLAHGEVSAHGVPLRDGTTAGVGDHLHARHNDRALTDDHGRWVRNGDPLTLTALHPDGSATATRRDTTHRPGPGHRAAARRLPRRARRPRLRPHRPPRPRPHRRHRPPRPDPRHHPRSPLRRPHPRTRVQRRLDHHHPHRDRRARHPRTAPPRPHPRRRPPPRPDHQQRRAVGHRAPRRTHPTRRHPRGASSTDEPGARPGRTYRPHPVPVRGAATVETSPLSVPPSTDAVIPLPRAPHDDGSDQPRILITLPETARILGVGRSTVSRLVRQGALECVSIGSLRRVPLQSVHDFVDQLRADANGN